MAQSSNSGCSATRSHPSVIETQEELYQLIISLPSDGPLFTVIYPTWSIFILAATCDVARRQPLFRLLQAIEERNKGVSHIPYTDRTDLESTADQPCS